MLPSLTGAVRNAVSSGMWTCFRCSSSSGARASSSSASQRPIQSAAIATPSNQLLTFSNDSRQPLPGRRLSHNGHRSFVSSSSLSNLQRRTSSRALASTTIHAPPDAIVRDLEQLLPTLPSLSSSSTPPTTPPRALPSQKPAQDALILVTPGLTHLLNLRGSSNFLPKAVGHIFHDRDSSSHVCAVCAVVDALPGSHEGEGVSILALGHPGSVESVFGIHPDLSNPENAPGALLSFRVRDETFNGYAAALTAVDVPTANTIFQNGRRSTLHWSRWAIAPPGNPAAKLVHSQDILRADVNLTQIPAVSQDLAIAAELVPVTHLRRISDGVGNVLRRVDVDGQSTPASRELEGAVPALLSRWKKSAGSVGVWVVLLPGHALDGTPLKTLEAVAAHFGISPEPADGTTPMGEGQLAALVAKGARILKVLSGGGGWGPKQGLLSLDPDYYLDYTTKKTFVAEDWAEQRGAAWGSIASPGSWVQFYASDADNTAPDALREGSTVLSFGALKKDEDTVIKSSSGELDKAADIKDGVFGCSSQIGIGLRYRPEGLEGPAITSKIDMPGSQVTISLQEKARS